MALTPPGARVTPLHDKLADLNTMDISRSRRKIDNA